MEQLGERLRRLRGKRSVPETAEALGITEASLQAYEGGIRIPRDEIKLRMAAYYGIPAEIFTEREDQRRTG